jgi:hypothetical protein
MALKTRADYFPIKHYFISFYNRDSVSTGRYEGQS